MLLEHLCCDLAGSVGIKSAALMVRYREKRNEFLLLSIVLRILQLLIILEPLDCFKWGFQQNAPLQMSTSIKQKTRVLTCENLTDFPKSHHIICNIFD